MITAVSEDSMTDPCHVQHMEHWDEINTKALGLSNTASYANLDRILEELDYADRIMKRISCPIIDVATKAVEETANIIIEIMRDNQKDED